jgi:CheY-like chemotaxis protein
MGKTILVVDDDPALRRSIRTFLEGYGYAIREADGAREGQAAIREACPDLILTDIYMPDGDGFELIREIRNGDRPVPIVAMSGGAHPGYDQLEVAEKLGAVGIIDKPFRQSNLLEMVERALAGRGVPARR